MPYIVSANANTVSIAQYPVIFAEVYNVLLFSIAYNEFVVLDLLAVGRTRIL